MIQRNVQTDLHLIISSLLRCDGKWYSAYSLGIMLDFISYLRDYPTPSSIDSVFLIFPMDPVFPAIATSLVQVLKILLDL